MKQMDLQLLEPKYDPIKPRASHTHAEKYAAVNEYQHSERGLRAAAYDSRLLPVNLHL